MNKLITISILLFTYLSMQACLINAEEYDVIWSGFFDIQHNTYKDSSKTDGFTWGQFELDLETELSDKVSIEGAIAFNPASSSFGLGAGLLNIKAQNNLEVAFGQFDVPIGLDYNFYPSIDRPMIAIPLLNQKMYNNWNDLGIRVMGKHNNISGALFIVNGQNLQPSWGKAQSIGGRIGITLQDSEVGFSLANDPTNKDAFSGLDLTHNWNNLNIISEYMSVNNSGSNKAYSYYVQGKYDLGYYFLTCRYGQYNEDCNYDRDNNSFGNLSRITLGGGLKVDSNTELRVEYQLNSEDNDFNKKDNDALLFQAVVGF